MREASLRGAGERKVYTVYGNCQAAALARMLQMSPGFAARFRYVEVAPVHLLGEEELRRVQVEVLPTLDLFLYMPVGIEYHQNPEYASRCFVERLPPRCTAISVPNCYFRGYNPELVYLRGLPLPDFSDYTDLSFLALFLEGERDPERMAGAIGRDDLVEGKLIREVTERSLEELERREESGNDGGAIDIRVSGYLREHFRERRLFHTFNHPSAEVLSYLADGVLAFLGLAPVPRGQVEDLLSNVHYPIYECVRRALDLEFSTRRTYRLQGHDCSPTETARRYIRYFSAQDDRQLRSAAAETGWRIGKAESSSGVAAS